MIARVAANLQCVVLILFMQLGVNHTQILQESFTRFKRNVKNTKGTSQLLTEIGNIVFQ